MCGAYVNHYVDNEYREGQAPRDSGNLCVRGTFYRRHEIPCPICEAFITTQLTDVRAAFGIALNCQACGHRRIYTWTGRPNHD